MHLLKRQPFLLRLSEPLSPLYLQQVDKAIRSWARPSVLLVTINSA
jgi:hypothetical protein